jgi:hypothetical protein
MVLVNKFGSQTAHISSRLAVQIVLTLIAGIAAFLLRFDFALSLRSGFSAGRTLPYHTRLNVSTASVRCLSLETFSVLLHSTSELLRTL